MKTKREFVWSRGCSCLPRQYAQVTIPSGAPVRKDELGNFWVVPSFFKDDTIVSHDATYYGCCVSPDNVDFSEYGNPMVYTTDSDENIHLPAIDYSVDGLRCLDKMKEAHLIASRLSKQMGAVFMSKIGAYDARGYSFNKQEFEVVKAYLDRQGFRKVY